MLTEHYNSNKYKLALPTIIKININNLCESDLAKIIMVPYIIVINESQRIHWNEKDIILDNANNHMNRNLLICE